MDFLDELCSLYESQYMTSSLLDSKSLHTFTEQVCKLAGANDLPSDDYGALLSSFSVDMIKKQMDKVCISFFALKNND